MKKFIVKETKGLETVLGIGSGGNINKFFKMSRLKEGSPISYGKIKSLHKMLSAFTARERVRNLGMRPDRADVIVPAGKIYLSVMKWGGVKKMYVPQLGLSDGIIHVLYERHKNQATAQS